MLRLNSSYTTPQNLPVTGSVWRWARLEVDAQRLVAAVVIAGYADLETAQAGGGLPQPFERKRYEIKGDALAAVIGSDPAGGSLSDRISAAIYAHVRATDALFAGAEDVGL